MQARRGEFKVFPPCHRRPQTSEEAAHDGTLALSPALSLSQCPTHTVIPAVVSCYITAEAAPSPSINHCLGMAGTVPGMQEGPCAAAPGTLLAAAEGVLSLDVAGGGTK